VTPLLLLLSVALSLAARPASAASDVGYRDFLFGSNCDATPTGEKPESKLWWNDGSWWGSLCAPDNTYHIYKLNLATQTWQDTTTPLDNRPNSRADILWDNSTRKLYVASHVFIENAAAPTPNASDWGRLYRYSYNPANPPETAYSLDTGFPVNVTRGIEEALVLAKDSTGTLWVTYVESKKVMVNHSSGSDTSWGTPKLLNVATGATNLTNDDIAADIAFDTTTASPKIGVLWSNHTDKKMYFAVHQDSNPNDQAWSSFAVYAPSPGSPDAADDHINIKLQSDGRGVYTVTKTSNSVSSQPLIVLLACTAGCDSANQWQAKTVYTKGEHHTRAILLIDTDHNTLNIFSTNPESGGVIYRKSAPISNIAFPPGHGSVFIKSAADSKINNPTSTKGNVNGTTGLVILAADATTRHYLHNYDPLDAP
jgi:hypothetical protein